MPGGFTFFRFVSINTTLAKIAVIPFGMAAIFILYCRKMNRRPLANIITAASAVKARNARDDRWFNSSHSDQNLEGLWPSRFLRVDIRWEKLTCAAERAMSARPPNARRVFDPRYPHQVRNLFCLPR